MLVALGAWEMLAMALRSSPMVSSASLKMVVSAFST